MKKQLFLGILMCPLLGMAQNLVVNGDFETTPGVGTGQSFANWTELETQPSPPAPANFGGTDITPDGPTTTANQFPINANITCRMPSTTGQREIKSDVFTVIPGKTYRLTYTYRIRLTNSQSGAGGVTTSNFQADVFSSPDPDPITAITPASVLVGTNAGNSNVNVTVTKDMTVPVNADYTKVYINLTKFSGGTPTSNSISWVDDVKFEDVATLPITLTSFTGKSNANGVALAWTTASESNNSKFTVERNNDGRNFSEIGTIKGSGSSSSTNNYNFTDANPIDGVNYYRLSQTDLDGTTTELKIISIDFTLANSKSNVQIYSDENKINASFNWKPAESVNISVLDLAGKTLSSANFNAKKGANSITLDTSDNLVSPGVKILIIKSASGAFEATKFVIN